MCRGSQLGLLHPQIAGHQRRLDVADQEGDVLRVYTLCVLQHMAFRGKLQEGRDQQSRVATRLQKDSMKVQYYAAITLCEREIYMVNVSASLS